MTLKQRRLGDIGLKFGISTQSGASAGRLHSSSIGAFKEGIQSGHRHGSSAIYAILQNGTSFQGILERNPNTYFHAALMESVQLHCQGYHSWFSALIKVLGRNLGSVLPALSVDTLLNIALAREIHIKKVKKLFGSAPRLNKKQVNSETDAIIHAQAQLMNASKSPGHRANIAEIQRATKKNKELQAVCKDKEKMAQLLQDPEEYQQDKKQGARVSNKMGALHATKLLCWFKDEFAELHQSTEIAGFGIFICETFESSVQPTIIGGGPIADFFMQTFKKSIWEVLCLFESYTTIASKCDCPYSLSCLLPNLDDPRWHADSYEN
ncbi:hypothetical protein GYMLUDRAFT_63376 [Collybiopsis luxurians FD-317 M1]|uniref:Uncharacterized protein n=1 Tax=Collybiopsis luxurians FD-317 M1 TaxID=944289 RepID=A0A0D0BWJ3_9AGAR|nr:hypothetical protein GYMLUDRAFT_63376 [Collybiopsis luxurians FD-317 M1]